jgi:hypothetical protein
MSVEAFAAFKAAQERVRSNYKDVGEDSDMLAERIISSFQAAFDKPPIEAFEMILQKAMTADEVRVALFAPREEQVKYYPILLMAGIQPEVKGLEESHPILRLKSLVLSTIFLLHKYSWKGFLEEFVIRGGLDILAYMLAEPNLYFRGQVVEIFLTITDCDNWDWFLPRSDILGRTLHIRFLELTDHPHFLDNLILNRQQTYPGGSMRCLQLLAFWLSWVRAMYTMNQVLHLSSGLLSELRFWSMSTSSSGEESSTSDQAQAEERNLAATLFQDFSDDQYKRDGLDNLVPAIPAEDETGKATGTLSVHGVDRPAVDADVEAKVKTAFERIGDKIEFRSASKRRENETSNNADQIKRVADSSNAAPVELTDTAAQYKDQGNTAFGFADFASALALYQKALQACLAVHTPNTESEPSGDFVATLHFNCAACHWKLYSQGFSSVQPIYKSGILASDGVSHASLQSATDATATLSACAEHCRAALRAYPRHHKAGYRLAAVLLAQNLPELALETVDNTLSKLMEMPSAEGGSDITYSSLRELRARCVAAAMLAGAGKSASSSAVPEQAKGLSSRAASVLAALQRRKQREDSRETHALASTWEPPAIIDDDDDPQNARDKIKKNTSHETEDIDVSEYFGASNVYTGAAGDTRVRKATKGASVKANDVAESDSAQKDARMAEKRALRKRLQDSMATLKRAMSALEKGKYSSEVLEAQRTPFVEALQSLWVIPTNPSKSSCHTLNSAFSESSITLEEPQVVALLRVAQNLLSNENTRAIGIRCAVEVTGLDRLQSVLRMALYGNAALRHACEAVTESLRGEAEEGSVHAGDLISSCL